MFRLPEKQWPNTKLLRTIPCTTCWRYIFISQGLLWLYPCLLANCPPFPRLFLRFPKRVSWFPLASGTTKWRKWAECWTFPPEICEPSTCHGDSLAFSYLFFFGGFVIHDMPWEPLQSVYKSLILMTIPQEFGNLHQVLTMAHLSF